MLTIPCEPAGAARWTQRTELGGREYLLSFQWSQRAGRWLFTLADQDSADIVTGQPVVVDWPLLGRRVVDARRPPGELVAVDTTGAGADPGFADLGARVVLVYFDPAEIAP